MEINLKKVPSKIKAKINIFFEITYFFFFFLKFYFESIKPIKNKDFDNTFFRLKN